MLLKTRHGTLELLSFNSPDDSGKPRVAGDGNCVIIAEESAHVGRAVAGCAEGGETRNVVGDQSRIQELQRLNTRRTQLLRAHVYQHPRPTHDAAQSRSTIFLGHAFARNRN